MRAYYNDNDQHIAAWLRELIRAGLVMDGDVDDRSITDVRGKDLEGYTRVHLFAGIGGWDYALQLAGWPPTRPVWTGSCPCQPLSSAGRHRGEQDPRHLWPHFYWLIAECHPATIFGEQVASRDGREWLAGVRADLETLGYAVGAADLCAAGVAAPHIRQRLYWVAYAGHDAGRTCEGHSLSECGSGPGKSSSSGGLADRDRGRREQCHASEWRVPVLDTHGTDSGLADSKCWSAERQRLNVAGASQETTREIREQRVRRDAGDDSGLGDTAGIGSTTGISGQDTRQEGYADIVVNAGGYWSDAVWISCGDGQARRIKPGLSPLVDGVPGRVGLLRGYGNAIVPQVAAVFIRAFMESEE